jgi:hypothetical protein
MLDYWDGLFRLNGDGAGEIEAKEQLVLLDKSSGTTDQFYPWWCTRVQ